MKKSLLIIFLAFVIALHSTTAVLAADSAKPWKCKPTDYDFALQNFVVWSECCGEDNTTPPSTTAPSGSGGTSNCKGEPLPDSIPEYWRNLIDRAAEKYPDTDRRLVAATLWIENRGWPDPNKQWGTSSASASGPWQFIPSSWESMGEDCNGDGVKNVNDPEDAVCAAFVHLKGSACKPILDGATGDAEADYNNVNFQRNGNNTLMSALANYNGRGVDDGKPLAQQQVGDENSDYVKMGYWLIASGFTQTINEDTGEKIDPNSKNSSGGSGGNNVNVSNTGSGGTTDGCAPKSGEVAQNGTGKVVQIDGKNYSFPLAVTKDAVVWDGGSTPKWPCSGNCHRGEPAFDLAKPNPEENNKDKSTGTPIVAIADGEISWFQSSYKGEDNCPQFGIQAEDGKNYYYIHTQDASVQLGTKVKAGQQIATIGRYACTGNGSYAHLHIDINNKSDSSIIPLINKLYESLGGSVRA